MRNHRDVGAGPNKTGRRHGCNELRSLACDGQAPGVRLDARATVDTDRRSARRVERVDETRDVESGAACFTNRRSLRQCDLVCSSNVAESIIPLHGPKGFGVFVGPWMPDPHQNHSSANPP